MRHFAAVQGGIIMMGADSSARSRAQHEIRRWVALTLVCFVFFLVVFLRLQISYGQDNQPAPVEITNVSCDAPRSLGIGQDHAAQDHCGS